MKKLDTGKSTAKTLIWTYKLCHRWNETSGNGVAQTVSRGKTTNIKQDPDSRFFAASDSSRKGGAKAAGY